MKNFKLALLLVSGLWLTSCVYDQEIDSVKKPDPKPDTNITTAYFNVNLAPTASVRDDIIENGNEEENAVKNALLVFTDKDDKFIAYGELEGKISSGLNETTGTKATFKVENAQLTNLLSGDNQDVNVFVICNYPYYIINDLSEGEDIQQVLTYTGTNSYWSDSDGFLMSNSEYTPTTIDIQGAKNGQYSSAASAYSLGSVKVQRVVARFDIAPPSSVTQGIDKIKVTFTGASLINISQNFYLFKEVSNVTPSSSSVDAEWTKFLVENGNYVRDPKGYEKISEQPNYSTLFINPANSSNSQLGGLTMKSFSTLQSEGNKDSNDVQLPSGASQRDYYIFEYCTPNSIPDASEQNVGNTTGIVFEAELSSEDIKDMKENKSVIAYNGTIYGSKSTIEGLLSDQSEKDQKTINMLNAYKAATEGKTSDEDVLTALKSPSASGFTVYTPDDNKKYKCYYIYWNKHRENNTSDIIPMEYGVVRNNIYKLAVTKVNSLGHPGYYKPDPTAKLKSDTSDEYFSVDVQILPWNVKVNDIEF